MTKSLLISQPSSRMVNVLNELAKYLVVKRVNKDVLEKLDRGETVEAYLYCTKGKPYLYYGDLTQQYEIDDYKDKWGDELNATIPVKVVIDGYDTYYLERPLNLEVAYRGIKNEHGCEYSKEIKSDLIKHSGLTFTQLFDYGTKRFDGQQSVIKTLHISKVEIFDKSMILMQLHEKDVDIKCGTLKNDEETIRCYEEHRITKAPQNMMSVWVK